MKLKIELDELVSAFEPLNVSRHYFIDTQENEIIYINSEIEDNASEKLEKMDDERYVHIPIRLPKDDFLIMELFVYELEEAEFEFAEKFQRAIEGRKPFRNFKALLLDYPEIREKWFKYKDKHIKNETINWLCENGIELENQQPILIEILELEGLENLPESVRVDIQGFNPTMCVKCQNKEGLKARLFLINVPPDNLLIEKETKRIMKDNYGIEYYGNYTGGEKDILTASKCPKCGSEEVIWDY